MNSENKQVKKKSLLQEFIGEINPGEMKRTRDRMKLAAKIDQLLIEKGLSKGQFAKFMGKEPSVISKWLSGTHNFTTDTLSDISDCLGVSLFKLFEETTPPIIHKANFAIKSPSAGVNVRFADGELGISIAGIEPLRSNYGGLPIEHNMMTGLIYKLVLPSTLDDNTYRMATSSMIHERPMDVMVRTIKTSKEETYDAEKLKI